MKKILSVGLILVFCLVLFSGCGAKTDFNESKINIVHPLEETLDVNNLTDCTVAISLEKGNVYIDDAGKMQMKVKVFTYDLYDVVDIATLKAGDTIVRLGKNVEVAELDRLDTGLVRINGGEENGGFDLISNDSTVYYEIGMSDIKSYYELGEATLPVSAEFVYTDESDPDAAKKEYYPGNFLTEDAGIIYSFIPNNTSIVVESGEIIRMNKYYMP